MSEAGGRCQPIVLLGTGRRERLAQVLQQAVEDWRRQWSGDIHGAFDLEIAESLCRRPALVGSRQAAFGVDGATGPLLVAVVPMDMQSELLGLPSSRAAADDVGETANAVFAEAMHALCLRVACARPAQGVNVAALAGDTLARTWNEYGLTVTMKTGAERVLLRLRLFPQLLLELLPSRAGKPTDPLVSRRGAIGNEKVHVQAWLGEAEVTLGDLTNLQVGEVILLDTSLAGTGHLALPDGRPLAPVRLGSAAGHRAVSVVGKAASQLGP